MYSPADKGIRHRSETCKDQISADLHDSSLSSSRLFKLLKFFRSRAYLLAVEHSCTVLYCIIVSLRELLRLMQNVVLLIPRGRMFFKFHVSQAPSARIYHASGGALGQRLPGVCQGKSPN